MAAARAVDPTAEAFADIICSDQDWVDAEFEEIVAAFLGGPAATVTVPPTPATLAQPSAGKSMRTCRFEGNAPGPTGRSPPRIRRAYPTHAGRWPAYRERRLFHHVDVI